MCFLHSCCAPRDPCPVAPVLQPSYLGPITVSVNCPLTNAAGQSLSAPIQPLTFSVLPIVAVRSSAYRIGGSVMQVAGTAAPEGPSDNPAK